MMKARVKYPTGKNEDKKITVKKTVVTAGPISNGEIKCNGAASEPLTVDNCQSREQKNLHTEGMARQTGGFYGYLSWYKQNNKQ